MSWTARSWRARSSACSTTSAPTTCTCTTPSPAATRPASIAPRVVGATPPGRLWSRRRREGRPHGVAPTSLSLPHACPLRQRMVFAHQGLQALVGDVGVDLGRGDVRVAEHLLDAAEVGSVIQEMGCEGVAQDVRRDLAALDAGGERKVLQQLTQALAGEMAFVAV